MRTMDFQAPGATGPRVSKIALGCMELAGTWHASEVGPENLKKAIATVEAALDIGINFFDHADFYGETTCESLFKECLAALKPDRESLIIATKCGIKKSDIEGGFYDLSYKSILKAADDLLKRLGIEYIDLYQMHRPDPMAHPRDTAAAIEIWCDAAWCAMWAFPTTTRSSSGLFKPTSATSPSSPIRFRCRLRIWSSSMKGALGRGCSTSAWGWELRRWPTVL